MKKFYILMCLFCSACSSFYGLKYQKEFNQEKFLQFSKKNSLDSIDVYYIGKNYFSFLKDRSFEEKKQSFLLQPLQAHYFRNDSLISSHVNCNIGGFPNLKWNEKKYFNVFPPKTQFDLGNITLLFSQIKPYLSKLQAGKHNHKTNEIVLVFGNLFLEKQTRILLKQVFKNASLAKITPNIIFINNDSWFID